MSTPAWTMIGPPVRGRRCGGCTLLPVRSIGKRAVTRCRHQLLTSGMLSLSGLTPLDLRDIDPQALSMSNVSARRDVRDLVRALDLPAIAAA